MAHRSKQSRNRLYTCGVPRESCAVDRRRGRELIAISVLSRSIRSWRGHQRLLAVPSGRVLQHNVPPTTAWRILEYCIHTTTTMTGTWRHECRHNQRVTTYYRHFPGTPCLVTEKTQTFLPKPLPAPPTTQDDQANFTSPGPHLESFGLRTRPFSSDRAFGRCSRL